MEPRYITEAKALLGEKEIKGRLANEKIVELFKDSGHNTVISDEVPWCSAFVGACLARANKPHTGSLVARSYLNYGKKLDEPEINCIGIMKRGNSSWEGHVGFVVAFDKTSVTLLGGNQKNSVSIQKFPRKSFIGFVVPKEETMDMSEASVVNDSRRLTLQTWGERIYATGAAAIAGIWAFAGQIVELAKDNVGLVLLTTVGLGWLLLKVLKGMSIREYRQGRYQPKKQWEA